MKQNEQVLEAWLQMTTVINNERITPDLPYNESMICRYLYQNQDIIPTKPYLCYIFKLTILINFFWIQVTMIVNN